jgi:PAB-dependent poly(A)-specific ribonuclease subunit 2
MAFDNSQELLWVGNQYGRIMSFYGPELQRYTSYIGHAEPVRQILLHEKGVISVSPRSVHMASRTGPTLWHLTYVRYFMWSGEYRC